MLSLIQKHKLNIEDIEISILLEQFLLYLREMREANAEIASEFMEMAAHLILIKTSALLPKQETEQMKKELEGALIEYAACKEAALRLKEKWIGGSVFVREPLGIKINTDYRLHHDIYELFEAFSALKERSELIKLRKAPIKPAPVVSRSYVSVFTKIVYVLRRIQQGGEVEINSLYIGQNRSEQVATFLALLELSKQGHISFSQDNTKLEFVGKRKTTVKAQPPEIG